MKTTFDGNENSTKQYIDSYVAWRYKNYTNKVGFFPIFSDFSNIIGHLSTGAVTLYVYLGLKANTRRGTSFYSISRIAEDLHKSTRTISSWINELKDNDLIYRKQEKLNGVTTTYLRPY